MKSIKFFAVAICTLLAGAAFAQDTSAPEGAADMSTTSMKGNFEAALRVSYGLGLGNIYGESTVAGPAVALSDVYSGALPLQLDLGYRFNSQWFAGAYNGCTDCSSSQMRFGIEGQYHLMPAMSLDPWVGLGVGYELVNISAGGASSTTSGLEFANISVGGNYKVASNFAVGPVISFGLGSYSKVGGNDSPATSMHMLLDFGVRGVFDML